MTRPRLTISLVQYNKRADVQRPRRKDTVSAEDLSTLHLGTLRLRKWASEGTEISAHTLLCLHRQLASYG
jgi:hypothetical protein